MNISRLPKWAQEHIRDIERERETAIRALNEYVDNQTPSSFYFDDAICTGEKKGPSFKRKYIQTHKITIAHQGVQLDILLRDDHIDLQWSDDKRLHRDVAFIPGSYQQAKLISKDNMN